MAETAWTATYDIGFGWTRYRLDSLDGGDNTPPVDSRKAKRIIFRATGSEAESGAAGTGTYEMRFAMAPIEIAHVDGGGLDRSGDPNAFFKTESQAAFTTHNNAGGKINIVAQDAIPPFFQIKNTASASADTVTDITVLVKE